MPRLIIKVPTEDRDLAFEVETDQLPSVSLVDLQNFVRQEIGGATLNRRLRFVYQGQVLTTATNLSRDVFGTQQQAFLLCTIGRILTPEEIEAEQTTAATGPEEHASSAPAPQRGFEQLRDAGFAEEEIQLLRSNFGELYGATERNDNRARTTAERLEQEEAWLSGTSARNARYELVDEAMGLLIGAFAGIAVIFLLQLRILNPVQQRMAVAGALLNLVFTAFRKFAS